MAAKSYGLYKLLTTRQGKILCVNDMKQAYVWHRRLVHVNATHLTKLASHKMATGVSLNAQGASKLKKYVCEPCISGKHARKPFSSSSATTPILEVVHSDLAGPVQVKSLGGAYYFVTYLDDFTGYSFVRMLRTKS
jgi:hypothetical protein